MRESGATGNIPGGSIMESADAIKDWNQRALIGAIVDLRHRTGFVRDAGRVEAVHEDGSVTVGFPEDVAPARYAESEWTMILAIGRQTP
jgi:hypothetical protein